jgi:D-ribose pyranase
MKRTGLLHPELAAVVAALGHGQRICVGDAGLPVPPTTRRIQLGFAPGHPPFLDVVEAVLTELVVESAVVASELEEGPLQDGLVARLGKVPVDAVPHEQFKARLDECVAVVCTGEFTPYANVMLTAGVAF